MAMVSLTKTELALLSRLGFGKPVNDSDGEMFVRYGAVGGCPVSVYVRVLRDTNDGSVFVHASWGWYELDLPCVRYANERAVNADLPAVAVAVRKAVKAKCHAVSGRPVDVGGSGNGYDI